jgi:hypothetical protein
VRVDGRSVRKPCNTTDNETAALVTVVDVLCLKRVLGRRSAEGVRCDDAGLTGVKPVAAVVRTLAAVTSHPPSPALRALVLDMPSAAAAKELLDLARQLQAASIAGHPAPSLLQGKNLAVLQSSSGAAVSALHEAAADLGMRVARVSLGEPPPAVVECARIARMLGRMYDAIDVGTVAPAAAAQLAAHAGVPVYRGLADGSHPALALAGLLAPPDAGKPKEANDAANQRFILQALLLATIG